MHRQAAAVGAFTLVSLLAAPALSDEFVPVRDKDAFVGLVEGRELRLPLFRISLLVEPDGEIRGQALGWDVTGKWDWRDGYFCRELDWSGTPIPFNCQLVEVRADRELRFTVDKGKGDSARFRLQ
jgi:hypothetical protein